MFALKNKFRQVIIKKPEKTNFVSQLLSCTIKKYNDYQTISIKFDRKQRKNISNISTQTFQEHIIIYIALVIKQKINTAHINVIIAINFLQRRKDIKDTQTIAWEFLE